MVSIDDVRQPLLRLLDRQPVVSQEDDCLGRGWRVTLWSLQALLP
jgi:hypothetical protein